MVSDREQLNVLKDIRDSLRVIAGRAGAGESVVAAVETPGRITEPMPEDVYTQFREEVVRAGGKKPFKDWFQEWQAAQEAKQAPRVKRLLESTGEVAPRVVEKLLNPEGH